MNGSSKGNQVKVFKNGFWYKGDYLGYEGASECVVSRLLKHSNVTDFVTYNVCTFEYSNNLVNGCYSKNFKLSGEEEITLENLIQKCSGKTSDMYLMGLTLREKISKVVDLVQDMTGIENFGEYLTVLLELDKLTLNEDRHFHNIVLLRRGDGTYHCAPIFDNGAALLSDTYIDYPLGMPVVNAIRKVKAKPFSTSFSKQVSACEQMYGQQFKLLDGINVSKLVEGLCEVYENSIVERIKHILDFQLERYKESRDRVIQ